MIKKVISEKIREKFSMNNQCLSERKCSRWNRMFNLNKDIVNTLFRVTICKLYPKASV